MDVVLITGSAYQLPTSHRVDCIVHDGAINAKLWPGAGLDRELKEGYGVQLEEVLGREIKAIYPKGIQIGHMLRIHQGKLHANYLLWFASRDAEVAGISGKAPGKEAVIAMTEQALAYATEKKSERIAFSALGWGRESLPESERLFLIAQTAQRFADKRYEQGLPEVLEEVLVCSTSSKDIAESKRRLGASVRSVVPVSVHAQVSKNENTVREPKPKTSPASTRSRKPVLSEEDFAKAHHASAWDKHHKYSEGEVFVHAKFGVGKVTELTPDGFMMVLFADAETRKLIHNMPQEN